MVKRRPPRQAAHARLRRTWVRHRLPVWKARAQRTVEELAEYTD